MPDPFDRPKRQPEPWDIELPFPPFEGGDYPLERPRYRPVSGYEARCYSCGEDYSGRIEEPCYLVCGECLHAWFSEEEYVAHDASWRDGERRAASQILICPCCSHDL